MFLFLGEKKSLDIVRIMKSRRIDSFEEGISPSLSLSCARTRSCLLFYLLVNRLIFISIVMRESSLILLEISSLKREKSQSKKTKKKKKS